MYYKVQERKFERMSGRKTGNGHKKQVERQCMVIEIIPLARKTKWVWV